MKAPTSSFGCFDLNCEACHGDAEWQAQRVWVETEVDGDTSVDHLFHEECAPHINDSGRFEDGSSHYGWPHLECAGCGNTFDTQEHNLIYDDETGSHKCSCGSSATTVGEGTESGSWLYVCTKSHKRLGYSGL